MLKPISILLLCMFAGAAIASTHEAESALKDFEGKVLVLRHPLQESFQQYDAKARCSEAAMKAHGLSMVACSSTKLIYRPKKPVAVEMNVEVAFNLY